METEGGSGEAPFTPDFGSSRMVRSCYAELILPKVSSTSRATAGLSLPLSITSILQ